MKIKKIKGSLTLPLSPSLTLPLSPSLTLRLLHD
jgi:hypothetical protein